MGFFRRLWYSSGAVGWVHRGDTMRRFGRYQEAMRCYDRALDIDPSLADAWLQKGRLLVEMGSPDLGLNRLTRALEIDPRRAEAWVDKEKILRSMGKEKEAEICHKRAKDLGYSL